jgi:hypothetical protein
MVSLLPSGIGDRTLMSYEHGVRQMTVVRPDAGSQLRGSDRPCPASGACCLEVTVLRAEHDVKTRAALAHKVRQLWDQPHRAPHEIGDNTPQRSTNEQPTYTSSLRSQQWPCRPDALSTAPSHRISQSPPRTVRFPPTGEVIR